MQEAPPVAPVTPPTVALPPPQPGPDVYALLDACLRKHQPWTDRSVSNLSVAQVRQWVEVEHDPIWLEAGAWWLPLSGEGTPHSPSGIYISVPLDGSACGGAIVN